MIIKIWTAFSAIYSEKVLVGLLIDYYWESELIFIYYLHSLLNIFYLSICRYVYDYLYDYHIMIAQCDISSKYYIEYLKYY